jgi:hypothetical protein
MKGSGTCGLMNEMEGEFRFGLMDRFTKDTGTMERQMEEED